MSLTEAIEKAQLANERKIAEEIKPPQPDLDDEALRHMARFVSWAKSRGVKPLPCAPVTLAAFVRAENAFGVPPDRIFDAVRAVEQAHDAAAVSNPAATLAVRTELGRILNIEAPRTWPKADRPIFNSLPIEVRAVVNRRAEQDSKALRQLQNRVAEQGKKEETCQKNTDHSPTATETPISNNS